MGIPTGTRFGRYEIHSPLGVGGMGEVYLARDTQLRGRPVALKLLPAEFTENETRLRRFEQEAFAVSALNHPNIITIYEVGNVEGTQYIANEYVEGITLRQRMAGSRVELRETLNVCVQIASALAAAHQAGIVHRDIKPENVMLRPDGYVKVLDFGLVKLTEKAAVQPFGGSQATTQELFKTNPGAVMGTVLYMSPEQARGMLVDERTDLWSLGVLLYEAVAGRLPFAGQTASDVISLILQREPPPLAQFAAEASDEIARIVAKALAKDREERYQTAKDLLVDLRRLRQRLEFEAEMSRTTATDEVATQISDANTRAPAPATQAAATTPPAEQRKQLTVLVAAFPSFAELAETLDDEEANETLNALWRRVDKVVLDHGGMIDKHVGETIVALWGASAAREDDPEHAVRAALAMQTEAREFVGAESSCQTATGATGGRSDETASPLQVGINTGPVLLNASGAAGELAATGAAVNVAHRLQQAAPAGGIIVSHDTYRHVRGVFDVQPLELISVRGKTEPVQAYTVMAAKPRAFRLRTRGVEGIETRMVGRQAELDRLLDALHTVLEDRELRAVTVVGDAGLGKSRLLYEFSNEVELLPERIRIFNGRASEATRGLPFALVRNMFSFRFEIQESDSPEVARDKLESGILGLSSGTDDDALMRAHFIGHLLGFDFAASPHLSGILDDAKQIHERAFHYAAQFFADVTRDAPAIIYLDDLHWADDGSLDFVDHLARAGASLPLMLLCLSRPTLLELRPSWGEGQAAHTRVNLQPLSKRESRQLVEEILRHAHSVPHVLRELIVSGAEGNPFYVEELVKMLIDQGVIVPGADEWRVDASRLVEVQVPPTLTGVLQARLDVLSPWEKVVLQRASVVGRIFWDSAVEWLGFAPVESQSEEVVGDTREALEGLRRKELIYRREASGFAGTGEYIFKHALLRDVTYESVLKRERRRYHRAAAGWLVERSGGRADEYAGAIAKHYERAQDAERAAEWYGRAGEQAREAYAPEAASRYYRKALEFSSAATDSNPHGLAAQHALRVEWYEGLGEVLRVQALFVEAVEAYADMRAMAGAAGDRAAQARAWNGLAFVSGIQGDNRAMLESARQAETLARSVEGAGAKTELARALNWQGNALLRLGDAPGGMRLCEQVLALSVEVGEAARRVRAHGLNSMGVGHSMLGRFEQSSRCKEQALELFRELGDRRMVGHTLNTLGESARLRGDYRLAVEHYQESLGIAREIGDRAGQITCLNNLGGARVGLGDDASAEADLRLAVSMAGSAGYHALSEAYRFLAEACLGQGKLAAATEAAQTALALGRQTENQEFIGGAWRSLGLVAAAQSPAPVAVGGKNYDAAECFAESLRVFAEVGMDAEGARTLREWARHERARGDAARGRELWEEAREIFARLAMQPELDRMEEDITSGQTWKEANDE